MKILLALFLALNLSACAALKTVNNPLTPNNITVVEDAYGAAIAVAVTYRRTCVARLIEKSCFNTLERLKPYEAKAWNALKIAQRFVKDNPTLDATSIINLAMQAIKAFQDEQFINGVK